MKYKKHLVYAEDLLYEIMMYPSSTMTKGSIRHCAEKVIEEQTVSIWRAILDKIKSWFVKG
jgi:hypothetical protein